MMGPLNQCLKNGYHLVKISNGKNSKKFTASINVHYFSKHSNCCWYGNLNNMFLNQSVMLADLLLMFLYLEVLAMVRVFWESTIN